MKTQALKAAIVAVALSALCGATVQANTEFSYQGSLSKAGEAAKGLYDFRFAIYAAPSGGTPLTEPITQPAVEVGNGMFAVTLDFGDVFTGESRWLELAVRRSGDADFTTLSPRQPLMPAPYAIHANYAAVASSAHSVPAGSITGDHLAGGQLVRSLNNVTDHVTLEAGGNIAINRQGNQLTIAATVAEGPPGKQGLDWMGAYDPVEAYGQDEAVNYAGSAYIALVDRPIGAPGISSDWDLLVLRGEPGEQGPKGEKGDTGGPGWKGDEGAIGPQGPKGDQGDTGATGPQGEKGDQGDTGATGPQGPKGDKGDTGATGARGPQGLQGERGPVGLQGERGPVGLQGERGPVGLQGERGPVGPVGPVGTIVAFGGTTPPAGWLLCDGRRISRTMYRDLFQVIGNRWGGGDGINTFNVPDLGGVFLRGATTDTGGPWGDPHAAARTSRHSGGATSGVGSYQNDATKRPNANFNTATSGAHTHWLERQDGGLIRWGDGSGFSAYRIDGAPDVREGALAAPRAREAGAHSHTIGGGDAETRPKNAYVYYIIKY